MTSDHSQQGYARAGFCVPICIQHFLTPHSVTSNQQLQISHNGNIYTTEIGKCCKSGLPPSHPRKLVVEHLPDTTSYRNQKHYWNQKEQHLSLSERQHSPVTKDISPFFKVVKPIFSQGKRNRNTHKLSALGCITLLPSSGIHNLVCFSGE